MYFAPQVGSLLGVLQDLGLQRAQLGLLKTLLQHAGAEKRVGDLYSNRSFSSRFATMAKQNLRVRHPHTVCWDEQWDERMPPPVLSCAR